MKSPSKPASWEDQCLKLNVIYRLHKLPIMNVLISPVEE